MSSTIGVGGALHEFLHSLGFEDEYSYRTSGDAATYCGRFSGSSNAPNLSYVSIDDRTFSSEEEARSFLKGKIPWLDQIKPSVKILTDGKLGTPSGIYPNSVLGLFRGGACDSDSYQAFRPIDDTLMQTMTTAITPHYAAIIARAMSKVKRERRSVRAMATDTYLFVRDSISR